MASPVGRNRELPVGLVGEEESSGEMTGRGAMADARLVRRRGVGGRDGRGAMVAANAFREGLLRGDAGAGARGAIDFQAEARRVVDVFLEGHCEGRKVLLKD